LFNGTTPKDRTPCAICCALPRRPGVPRWPGLFRTLLGKPGGSGYGKRKQDCESQSFYERSSQAVNAYREHA
jgi:hypothetical protein